MRFRNFTPLPGGHEAYGLPIAVLVSEEFDRANVRMTDIIQALHHFVDLLSLPPGKPSNPDVEPITRRHLMCEYVGQSRRRFIVWHSRDLSTLYVGTPAQSDLMLRDL